MCNLFDQLIQDIPVYNITTPSQVNAIKNGFNSKGILPCKKKKCYYSTVCLMDRSTSTFENLKYGSPCLVEVALYYKLSTEYSSKFVGLDYSDERVSVIKELIMIDIYLNRINMMTAINSDFIRDVPRWNYGGFSLPLRYSRGLLKHKLFLLDKLRETSVD